VSSGWIGGLLGRIPTTTNTATVAAMNASAYQNARR
jgi:hypothetical protein